ncbi:MAG: efflux RND transporter periplasmic adaptor subunit [Chloroflexi bacterium]|nr:efflux RND transporter periplasmic adaptor subunit [Chloroflexota bacterium]
MKAKLILLNLAMILLVASASACQVLNITPAASSALTASGTISADSTYIAPQIAGKIMEIKVDKGATVKTGDILFTLDTQALQARRVLFRSNIQAAQAAVDAATQNQAAAQIQYDLALQTARTQDNSTRLDSWTADLPSEITQPGWYFQKSEIMTALQAEVNAAQQAYHNETANLATVLTDASNADFTAAEKNLAQTQEAYQIANQTLDQAKQANNNTDLVDAAQKNLDAAKADLDAAQNNYDQMLSSTAATNVREARARVAVAKDRLDNANYALDQLQTGSNSYQVQAAQNAISRANTAISQAQAGLAQAQAALNLVNIQISMATVTAPASGVVLSRPMNPGEIAAAGETVLEIGSLDTVTLTVYVPEDQYGKVQLGQSVTVTVDSFPGRTFSGTVDYISNQAEFTPRNVQTVESRSTTVYAVDIKLSNPDHALKPGMPADATF